MNRVQNTMKGAIKNDTCIGAYYKRGNRLSQMGNVALDIIEKR